MDQSNDLKLWNRTLKSEDKEILPFDSSTFGISQEHGLRTISSQETFYTRSS